MLVSVRKSHLSWYKQSRLIENFVAGTTARTAASLCGVNRKTAAHYFHRLREIIALETDAEAEKMLVGEIEVDESYFGGHRKGKRGRGAGEKVPVFGILERGGKVYTRVIPDASSATLCPIIERKVVTATASCTRLTGQNGEQTIDMSPATFEKHSCFL